MSITTDLDVLLRSLWLTQSIWSQTTFGSDKDRGPTGALRHLIKEAKEAEDRPDDIVEYADCLLLLLDATRRAGFKLDELVNAAIDKQKINEYRKWPKPITDNPVEHIE